MWGTDFCSFSMANTIEYVFTTKKALLVWSEERLPSLEINPKVFKFFSSPRVLSLEINIQWSCNQKLFCGDLKYHKWLPSHFLCMNPAFIFVFLTSARIFDSQWRCLSEKVFIQGNVRTVFHLSNLCFIKLMFLSVLSLTVNFRSKWFQTSFICIFLCSNCITTVL